MVDRDGLTRADASIGPHLKTHIRQCIGVYIVDKNRAKNSKKYILPMSFLLKSLNLIAEIA